jgi:hypothetical protein
MFYLRGNNSNITYDDFNYTELNYTNYTYSDYDNNSTSWVDWFISWWW